MLQWVKMEIIRSNVIKHGDLVCEYCENIVSSKDVNFDHVIPVSKGGKDILQNIVISCRRCNMWKRDKEPLSFIHLMNESQRGKDIKYKNTIMKDPKVKKSYHTEISSFCLGCIYIRPQALYCRVGRIPSKVNYCKYRRIE